MALFFSPVNDSWEFFADGTEWCGKAFCFTIYINFAFVQKLFHEA